MTMNILQGMSDIFSCFHLSVEIFIEVIVQKIGVCEINVIILIPQWKMMHELCDEIHHLALSDNINISFIK